MQTLALRCVPRSVSSPELRAALVAITIAAASLVACSRGARAVRLPASSPSEMIYRIRCEDSITACRDEAREVCSGRYEVLESSGAPIEPLRVTTAPGPVSTGPRYQRKKWVGQMVVSCGAAASQATVASQPEPTERQPVATPSPTPAPDRVCVPGATHECLGPGACRGAQACSADGNGYDPCDCGNASTREQSGARSPSAASEPTPNPRAD